MEQIIKKNLPVLGANIHSYEQQIRSAFRRRDRVSLNHRTAAWLASYFDILFAANRRFNEMGACIPVSQGAERSPLIPLTTPNSMNTNILSIRL